MRFKWFGLCALFFLWLWLFLSPYKKSSSQPEISEIKVLIRGEVEKEQTLTLPLKSTVGDLLELVELKETADLQSFNPATVLHDGDVITIPLKTESGCISINTASQEELMKLPGVGEATARAIISYREAHGYFQSIQDLMQVKGIGEVKFEKLKDLICL
ncbi:MAG: ComEA family DNA-binding protein [Erysipelotrichaceae bacterium]|jgi:competence protein ComEA|nr:ComEA family DNA-binding protein [Erysipelotrichaceae bacterium]